MTGSCCDVENVLTLDTINLTELIIHVKLLSREGIPWFIRHSKIKRVPSPQCLRPTFLQHK